MKQIKYCGMEYCFDEDSQSYDILPHKENGPKTFFKYYPLSENSVSALTELYIYATHPFLFNDPFDCNKEIVCIKNDSDMQSLWGELYNDFKSLCNNSKDLMMNYSKEALRTILYKRLGIVSLTEDCKNKIMWYLFGFKHKGPFPINYTDDIIPFDISKYGGNISMLIQTNIKNTCWKYEKEWRLLVYGPDDRYMKTFGPRAEQFNMPDDHDRKFHYSIYALKSVRLGLNFFYQNELYIISPNEYEIIYDDINTLDYKVINFLSNPQMSHINVYILQKDGININEIKEKPVKIVKVSNHTFRIITVK